MRHIKTLVTLVFICCMLPTAASLPSELNPIKATFHNDTLYVLAGSGVYDITNDELVYQGSIIGEILFRPNGNIIVSDSSRGIQEITPQGETSELVQRTVNISELFAATNDHVFYSSNSSGTLETKTFPESSSSLEDLSEREFDVANNKLYFSSERQHAYDRHRDVYIKSFSPSLTETTEIEPVLLRQDLIGFIVDSSRQYIYYLSDVSLPNTNKDNLLPRLLIRKNLNSGVQERVFADLDAELSGFELAAAHGNKVIFTKAYYHPNSRGDILTLNLDTGEFSRFIIPVPSTGDIIVSSFDQITVNPTGTKYALIYDRTVYSGDIN